MFTILLAGITFKLILMMQKIIENDFSRMELNLLTVFLVLCREVSVTRTAEGTARHHVDGSNIYFTVQRSMRITLPSRCVFCALPAGGEVKNSHAAISIISRHVGVAPLCSSHKRRVPQEEDSGFADRPAKAVNQK